MKREFSCRVYLNRSEMNAAQSQLKKVGVKTLPQLFRLSLEKLDTNLADEVLHLKSENSSLREKIKVADAKVELFKGDMQEFQKQRDDAEKALREKIEAYEKEVAVADALEKDFNETQDRADEFEELLYDQKTKYDECHEERVKYREVIRGVAEVIGWDGDALWIVADPIKIGRQSVAEVIGWNGDALDTFALRVQEIKTERDKYRPAYDFLCHELGLRNNEVYDEKHFTSEFEKLFAILEDDQDAHSRLGLRLENIFARYNYARRTQNEYFQLLCKRLALDSGKPYSLNDFEVAFDRLLGFEDEDNSFEMPPETVSFWERIKRLFRRKS